MPTETPNQPSDDRATPATDWRRDLFIRMAPPAAADRDEKRTVEPARGYF